MGTRRRTTFPIPFLVAALFGVVAPAIGGGPPSFEERLAAQRAIEEVYWQHRVWPRGNPGPKPPLSAVLPDEVIRATVVDYLKRSNALSQEHLWGRPITAAQLQAELDRMSRNTRDAELLGDLYDALDNDARLIAETLARRTLAERLLRSWYAHDNRFHRDVKRQAEEALARTTSVSAMRTMGGQYGEATYALQRSETAVGPSGADRDSVQLAAEAWAAWTEEIANRFGNLPGGIPLFQLSGLHEDKERFFVMAVLASTAEAITVATVGWAKQPFETWWAAEKTGLTTEIQPEPGPFTLTAPSDTLCTDDTWQPMWALPDPRDAHTAVWTGSELIVWGGKGGGILDYHHFNSGGRYDPSTDSWVATSTDGAPDSRSSHTAVWTGTEMLVWGGSDGQPMAGGGRYSPATDTWAPTSTAEEPAGRSHPTAVWTGSRMIVWGGEASGVKLNTGGRYDPSTDTWLPTSIGARVPTGRYWHTAVWTGSEMIVWGGLDSDGILTNGGGRYDPTLNRWKPTSLGANVPTGRWGHTAVWTGDEMIVWGGSRSSGTTATGGRYDPVTNSWLATGSVDDVPSARSGHVAVWTGSEMIVWGGSSGSGAIDTGGRYDPSTDGWLATSAVEGMPSARYRHTAVWTGTEMIVWGGSFGAFSIKLNTGGRYDPSTDGWLATSTGEGVPMARYGHTAVWTGAEMIVWGGLSESTSSGTATGGRYDASTDAWQPIATEAGLSTVDHTAVWTGTEMIVSGWTSGRYNPMTDNWVLASTGPIASPLYNHTAVWTGTEMILWGGHSSGWPYFPFSSGVRYDPSTDAWQPTATGTGVPAARYDHTAVWTGGEMIVWGGTDYDGQDGGALSTGGRYDPSTDSWTATSTGANAPAARWNHTAVWTGDEMIVWGSSSPNTGGRYDPATNSWMETSTGPGAPVRRSGHRAVWTGVEMIVWGGSSGSGGSVDYYDTGGRYDPSTNSWVATSLLSGVPSPRDRHTAVWTGGEMLVWGGFPLSANGARYCGCPVSTTSYPDVDGDGYGDPDYPVTTCDGSIPPGHVAEPGDCDDANGSSWHVPGDALGLAWTSAVDLEWWAPESPGCVPEALAYDCLRAESPLGFGSAVCIETNGSNTAGTDDAEPAAAGVYFYLVRAENGCGSGSSGAGTAGPRPAGIDCNE